MKHGTTCKCYQCRLERYESALRVIRTWASCDGDNTQTRADAMEDIVWKCDEALGIEEPNSKGE
jgi:hypothetical protein